MTTDTTKSGTSERRQPLGKIANALLEMQFNCSENAMNLLMFMLQHVQVLDLTGNPDNLVHFERNTLKAVANLERNGGRLLYVMEELRTTVFTYQDNEHNVLCAPMVAAYSFDAKLDTVTVEFSRLLWPHISQVLVNYTVLDLARFFFIQGKYCKRFYLDVMRWANKGTMHLQLDNMRTRYGMDYDYTDIQRRVIDKALAQIHEKSTLRVVKAGEQKQGKKVVSLSFHITRPGIELTQPTVDLLVNRYKIAKGLAGKIAKHLTQQTIRDILAGIDAAGARQKIRDLGAFSSTVFRAYL